MTRRLTICVGFSLVVLTASDASAITFCFDYVIARLTMADSDRMQIHEFRQTLEAFGFTPTVFSPSTDVQVIEDSLQPGDVVLFGGAHTGLVNGNRLIDHYIQDATAATTTGVRDVRAYTLATVAQAPTFRQGWRLADVRNYRRPGTQVEPYRWVDLTVWRGPNLAGQWTSNWGLTRIEQTGSEVRGTISYTAGGRGQVLGQLRFALAGVYWEGTWSNATGSGTFRLSLSRDSRSLNGQWIEPRQNRTGAWQLTR